jgi:hypothetical protein
MVAPAKSAARSVMIDITISNSISVKASRR